MTDTPREGPHGPEQVGSVLAGSVLAGRLAEVDPADTSDDTPVAVGAEVLERRRRNYRQIWQDTLDLWPDDDFHGAHIHDLTGDQKGREIGQWIADSDARLLMLTGHVGRGKSHATFAIGNYFASRAMLVRAYKHPRYLKLLQPDSGGPPPALIKQRAQDADVMLLDEFGAIAADRRTGAATPFAQEETTDLLSMRLRGDRRTVVNTNLSAEDLERVFDARTVSRLRRDATILHLGGVDRRRTGRADGWGWR